jgi:hypothetical protein
VLWTLAATIEIASHRPWLVIVITVIAAVGNVAQAVRWTLKARAHEHFSI